MNNEFESFLAQMKVLKSFNMIAYEIIGKAFLNKENIPDHIFNDESKIRKLFCPILLKIQSLSIDKPDVDVDNMPIGFFENNNMKAICFELPGYSVEPQNKFVALLFDESDNRAYYSAEVYSENELGICLKDMNNTHYALNYFYDLNLTMDEFVKKSFDHFKSFKPSN